MAPVPGDSSKHQFGTSMPQGGHPPHHSITSSARSRTASGILSPSALAVVRLMTKSIGYQLLYALYNDYDPDVAAEAFWRLLAVPVGGPILFLVIAWVVAGFSKSASNPVGPKPSTGYAIDEQEPTGEKFEVEASRNAASTS